MRLRLPSRLGSLLPVLLVAGCVYHPTFNQTIPVPASAHSRDVLEVAIDAAKAVGLPPATKVDKANGVVEFGAFGRPVTGYTAQVRVRSDGQLDVTVRHGSVYVPSGVKGKAQDFVDELQSRLRAGG
jgi:hypothetical protein